MKRVYDPDEDDYIPKTKEDNETETRPKAVVLCWASSETFKNDTTLNTHMNKHWSEKKSRC